MKKLVLSSLVVGVCLVGAVNAQLIGVDTFDYPNGAIAEKNGGDFWTWDNTVGDYTNGKSAWELLWGNAVVQGQALVTNDGGALRHYGSDLDRAAFRAFGVVYYSVRVEALNAQGWFGVSAYDFGNERIFFGMPGGFDGPLGNFGIDQIGKHLTNIPVEQGRVYHLIAAVDFEGQQVRMWVDPDSDDWDNGAADNSADLKVTYTGTNWNTGVRLASGGMCRWESVIVATEFWDVVPKVAKNPSPANGAQEVPTDEVMLSWDPAPDPENPDVPNPAITAHRLYTNFDNPDDPNLYFVAEIPNTGERAEYGPFTLETDITYCWRVDEVLPDVNDVTGALWRFETIKSTPIITGHPSYQVVEEGGAASFTVEVDSMSPPTFQWYRYVDGTNDIALTDSEKISGSQEQTLYLSNAQLDDEGGFYCIVSNLSGIPVTSQTALFGIKRRLAYWSFEDNNPNSVVPGSPTTIVYGNPTFVAGPVGNAMNFRTGLDMLYTDPNETLLYFDICNYTMTVACWVNTTNARTWVPFVARHGESGQGWQLRQGSVAGRPTFTTRGTGNDDGTRGDRTIADGNWHYVVGTFDGTDQKIKKLYIDGVLSKVYSEDTGKLLRAGDEVSGLINPTLLPVGIAGRVTGNLENMTIETWNIAGAKYDEVEIYNYVLDAETIAQKYADVTGQSVCVEQPENDLDGNCFVDLNDFVIFASEWLGGSLIQPNL